MALRTSLWYRERENLELARKTRATRGFERAQESCSDLSFSSAVTAVHQISQAKATHRWDLFVKYLVNGMPLK